MSIKSRENKVRRQPESQNNMSVKTAKQQRFEKDLVKLEKYIWNLRADRIIAITTEMDSGKIFLHRSIPRILLKDFQNLLHVFLTEFTMYDCGITFRYSLDNGKTFHVNGFCVKNNHIYLISEDVMQWSMETMPCGHKAHFDDCTYEVAPIDLNMYHNKSGEEAVV